MEIEEQRQLQILPHGRKQRTRMFNFPMLGIDSTYDSLDQAIHSIGEMAYNVGCEGLEDLYKQELASNPDCRPVVNLGCRKCDAYIKFLEVGDTYVLLENNSRHEHAIHGLTETEARYMQLFGYEEKEVGDNSSYLESLEDLNQSRRSHNRTPSSAPRSGNASFQSSMLNEQPIEKKQIRPPIQPPKKVVTQVDAKTQLKYLQDNQFYAAVKFGPEATGKQPQVFVLATPTMRTNFGKFGDWVGVAILPSSIQQFGLSYKIVSVWGYDSTIQPVLLSLALVSEETVASYYTVLKSMMRMLRVRFPCLVTDNDLILLEAITLMKEVGEFDPIHLMDIEVFNQEVDLRIKDQSKKQEIKLLVKRIIQENNLEKAQGIMKELDKTDITIADYLLEVQQRTCMWAMPDKFVGLSVSKRSKLIDLVQKELAPCNTLIDFFQCILKMEEQFIEALKQPNKRPDRFHEKIDELFEDVRLDNVKKELSSGLFTIFLQNYIQQFEREDCQLVEAGSKEPIPENKTVYTVDLKLHRCSCKYSWKTGLPCWHLLSMAGKNPIVTYTSLVNQRWRTPQVDSKPTVQPLTSQASLFARDRVSR